MLFNEKKTSFIQKKRTKTDVKIEKSPNQLSENKQKKLGPWSEEEDLILKKWVEEKGPCNWTRCSQLIPTRTGKQCRERWINYLNTNLKKGHWTSEEDLLILKLYPKYKSWKTIIPAFENRSENSIKNRYYTQLRKIVIRKKIYGNAENIIKMGNENLKQFYDEAVEVAEQKYLSENKYMTKEKFEIFLIEIENSLNEITKGKLIDLKNLREKFVKVKEDNNYDNDSISFEEAEENNKEKGEKLEKKEKLKYKSQTSKNTKIKKSKQFEDLKPYVNQNTPSESFVKRRSMRLMEKQLSKNYNNISLNKTNKGINEFEKPINPSKRFDSRLYFKNSNGLYSKDSINYTSFGFHNNLSKNKEFSSNTSWKLEPMEADSIFPLKSFNNSNYGL